jgi:hypothetical protein
MLVYTWSHHYQPHFRHQCRYTRRVVNPSQRSLVLKCRSNMADMNILKVIKGRLAFYSHARLAFYVSIYQQCNQIKSTFAISHSNKMNYNCLPWTNWDENVHCCSIVKPSPRSLVLKCHSNMADMNILKVINRRLAFYSHARLAFYSHYYILRRIKLIYGCSTQLSKYC